MHNFGSLLVVLIGDLFFQTMFQEFDLHSDNFITHGKDGVDVIVCIRTCLELLKTNTATDF